MSRLRKVCDEKIPAAHEIDVFDLSKNPQIASDRNIVADQPRAERDGALPILMRTMSEPSELLFCKYDLWPPTQRVRRRWGWAYLSRTRLIKELVAF